VTAPPLFHTFCDRCGREITAPTPETECFGCRIAAQSGRPDGLRDGTALGCIGLCKWCGKAIQLRRVTYLERMQFNAWVHFARADHAAVLKPGVCDG
jgi:hypothetical protein